MANTSLLTRVNDLAGILAIDNSPADCPDTLLRQAEAGADYLVRALSSKGKFRYSHDPNTGVVAKRYNILRHSGAIFAILETNEVVPRPAYARAAASALGFLDRKIEHLDGGRSRVVERGKAKIGGNALAALCHAMPATREIVDQGDGRVIPLLAWIVDALDAEGRFAFHKYDTGSGKASSFVSEYYPGEACLALVRGFEATGDERWLDAARRIANTRITEQQAMADPPHDHWLLYALDALDALSPSPHHIGHAAFLADHILAGQHGPDAPAAWQGGYDVAPRSTPTATRMEGLVAVVRMARRHGDLELERAALFGLARGIGFIRRCQVGFGPIGSRPANGKLDPTGGVVRGLMNDEIRIDYVQHAISAWLGYRSIILEQRHEYTNDCASSIQ